MDQTGTKPRITPKDFFLYVAAMVALYVGVGSLITLLFQYINILFPDPLDYYIDPFSGAIRFSMATLIIVFPLYMLFVRLVNREMRVHPEKREAGIRKWLIYITLFIAGAVVAGDLIALLNTFLGGELTTRFLLKVLVILVVVGSAFFYYFYDLKGRWQANERASKMVGWIAGALVLAVIIAGFVIIGTPGKQRLLRFDQEKVEDLRIIQSQIVTYWQQKETLPQGLADLRDEIAGFQVPADPQTGSSYEYRRIGNLTFELCAEFNVGSDQVRTPAIPGDIGGLRPGGTFLEGESWNHSAGRTCFERTIDPERYPTFRELKI